MDLFYLCMTLSLVIAVNGQLQESHDQSLHIPDIENVSEPVKSSDKIPFDVDCEVLDYESMKCWWIPGSALCSNPSKVNITYKYLKMDGNNKMKRPDGLDYYSNYIDCKNCSYHSNKTWTCWAKKKYTVGICQGFNYYEVSLKYRLKIKLKNLKPSCDDRITKEIYVPRYVKVSPVKELEARSYAINSTAYRLAWKPPGFPSYAPPVIYKIRRECKNGQPCNTELLTVSNKNEIDITDLEPFTEYSFFIKARAKSSKYKFSEEQQVDVKTPADVPGANPQLIKGAFRYIPRPNSDLYNLELFWKPIIKYQQHGGNYRINVSLSCEEEYFTTDSETTSTKTIPFDKKKVCNMYLWSQNDMGSNSSLIKPRMMNLNYHRMENLPKHADNFHGILSDDVRSVYLSWQKRSNSIATIYWCKNEPPSRGGHYCKDPLQSIVVDSDVPYITLNFTEPIDRNMIFGIGLEENGEHSGIYWPQCSFKNLVGPSVAPKITIEPWWRAAKITVDSEDCLDMGAFMQTYFLTICQTNDSISCIDESEQHVIESPARSITVGDLWFHTEYLVKIYGRTSQNRISPEKVEVFTTKKNCDPTGLNWKQYLSIVFGLLGVAAVTSALVCFCKNGKQPTKTTDVVQNELLMRQNKEEISRCPETCSSKQNGYLCMDSKHNNNISLTCGDNSGNVYTPLSVASGYYSHTINDFFDEESGVESNEKGTGPLDLKHTNRSESVDSGRVSSSCGDLYTSSGGTNTCTYSGGTTSSSSAWTNSTVPGYRRKVQLSESSDSSPSSSSSSSSSSARSYLSSDQQTFKNVKVSRLFIDEKTGKIVDSLNPDCGDILEIEIQSVQQI